MASWAIAVRVVTEESASPTLFKAISLPVRLTVPRLKLPPVTPAMVMSPLVPAFTVRLWAAAVVLSRVDLKSTKALADDREVS